MIYIEFFCCISYFPTCQINSVVLFISTNFIRVTSLLPSLQISVATAGPQLRAPEISGHCRTPTASSRSQWPLPDFNRIQPRAPDISGHCRTSTASSRSQRPLPGPTASSRFEWALRTSTASARSQWPLPDPNCELQISVATAGPQPRAQISVATAGPQPRAPDFRRERQISVLSQPRAPDLSGHCRTSTASSRYQ